LCESGKTVRNYQKNWLLNEYQPWWYAKKYNGAGLLDSWQSLQDRQLDELSPPSSAKPARTTISLATLEQGIFWSFTGESDSLQKIMQLFDQSFPEAGT
jgi:hypothetical protein